MSRAYLEIVPRDPSIARDGRPFNSGNRMKSLAWLYPSVVAGSLRTMVGKREGEFQPDVLKAIEVAGAFPVREGNLYFPAPADAVIRPPQSAEPTGLQPIALQPRQAWAGASNLPAGLWPVAMPDGSGDFKPAPRPAFLSSELMSRWLTGDSGPWPRAAIIPCIEKDQRTHVAIESTLGAAAESMIYTTIGLAMPPGVSLEARVGNGGVVSGTHPLGGERRLALWQGAASAAKGWTPPAAVVTALRHATVSPAPRVRLVLATPALFDLGWQPRWLAESQPVPGTNVRLKLLAACVDRGLPVSGWSLEEGRFGAKPSRRMAPAGSVYFCEILSGSAEELATAWLEPVSDREQDRLDGFGLALWGIWQ